MPIAVILVNMGGPESIDDVELYLKNIFNDPDIFDISLPVSIKKYLINWIIKRRIPKTKSIYQKIGGSSPLNKITKKQACLLGKSINHENKGLFDIYYAMRYWDPYFHDVWADLEKKEYKRAIIVPLYPQFSYSTTGSIINLWKRLDQNNIDTKIIRSYCDHPEYIKACVKVIKSALGDFIYNNETIELVMSAHGIPVRLIKKGDSYADEVGKTVREIARFLPPNVRISLGYQSKVGPLRWLKPSTVDVLKDVAQRKIKRIFIYPVSFVADNSETVYEIDILFRKIAKKMGIDEYNFIPSLNDHKGFINAIKQIITDLADGTLDSKYIYK